MKRAPMTYHRQVGELVILQDTREQVSPVWPAGVTSQRAKLDYADYSAVGLSDTVALELKWSLDDLVACVTGERDRFDTMLRGLAKYPVRALIVAGLERDVWAGNYHGKALPKTVIASCWAWQQDYQLPVIWAGSAAGAVEAICWWLWRAKSKKSEAHPSASKSGDSESST